jgi:hypothetical protein
MDMPSDPTPLPALTLLPGLQVVGFIVCVGHAFTVLTLPATQWLHGLKTARRLLSFSELLREDDKPEELLPWAGNV